MRRVDVGTGIFFVLFGTLALVLGWSMPMFQNDRVPGPGMFPIALSVCLIVFGGALALTRLMRDGDYGEVELPPRPALIRVTAVFVAFAVSVALISFVGFVVSALLFCAVYLLGVERQRNVVGILATILLPVTFYLLFDVVLNVPLPMGVFEA